MHKRKEFSGEQIYYHIFNRGVEKRDIFVSYNDYNRFLFLLLLLQGDVYIDNISRLAHEFEQHLMLLMQEFVPNIDKARLVQLVGFVLMPNHFHLIVKEVAEKGVSKFIQRICNSYAKYFNIKYKRSGHLFGSRYHKKLIDSNDYLLHLSAYIHRNPREIKRWRNKEINYPWSSYQDYAILNRWKKLLEPTIIVDQFKNKQEYKKFVQTSPSKEIENDVSNI